MVTVVPEGDEGPGWSGCAQEWRGQWAGLQMLGVLSVQVLVEAAGRCVSETRKMRMRRRGRAGEKSHEERDGAHNAARRCRVQEHLRVPTSMSASLVRDNSVDRGCKSISSVSKDIECTYESRSSNFFHSSLLQSSFFPSTEPALQS